MGRLAVISNPGSGRRRDRRRSVSAMLELLRQRGISAEAHETAAPGDATRLSQEAVEAGAQTIVVHGGDGTVRDLERVADMIAAGRARRVSVGRAGARYFLLMAGVGLDAVLVRAVSPGLKRLTGQAAYWVAGLRQFVDWRPRRFLAEVEERQYGATLAVIANAASYGGGLRLAPGARMDSEVLDLCLFDWRGRFRFLRHLRAGFSGGHLGLPGVTYLQARRITARGEQTWVQVDGELVGRLPMTFECVPAALSLIVP